MDLITLRSRLAFIAVITAIPLAACGDDGDDNGGGSDTGSDVGGEDTGSGGDTGGTDTGGTDTGGTDTGGTDTGGEDTGEEDVVTEGNIIEVATAAGGFTTLLTAIEAAGLTETLAGEGTYTVFAPTDEAFAALPEGTVEALLADPDALAEILLYHVVAAEVPSTAVTTGPALTAAEYSIWLSASDMGVMVNDANVTTPDVEASNGVIHIIDKVILPPNLVEYAGYTGEFDTLLAAATAADIAGLLQTEGPFTVFAPTDAAFELLPEGTVDALLADPETLAGILTYHAIVGAAVTSDLVEPGFISTAAEGLNAVIHLDEAEALSINNANIVITDIITTNGVVHVIDEVILPATVGELASYADDFSTLFTAVGAADASIAAALTDADANLTVFAPTNAAFAAVDADALTALLADQPALNEVLTYHVVGAEVPAADVTAGYVESLAELSFYIGTADGVTVNNATVVATDVFGTNGVIHAIDTVLFPSDIPTLVSYNPDFSTLLAAVGVADLAGALAGEGPLTLFAPTNAAFAGLPEGLVADLLDDVPPTALVDILTYHVFNGAVDSAAAAAAAGTSVEMLNGDTAAIASTMDGGLTIDGAPIQVVDVKATNGLIHQIGGVMVP